MRINEWGQNWVAFGGTDTTNNNINIIIISTFKINEIGPETTEWSPGTKWNNIG